MSWEHRKPDGVGDVEHTPDGFNAPVSIPVDEEVFFGCECPSCEGLFKMRGDEYDALPDDLELTCPYCGHREEHTAFLSSAQRERVMAAAGGLALQYVHQRLNDMLSGTFGRSSSVPRRPNSFISLETRYTPGSPPPVRALPDVVEKQTRRVVQCSSCATHYAVYSVTSFCPVCGPRPATDKVLEAIDAARAALAVEDRMGEDERETLRAAGVFERFAVDAIESVVSLFELFARDQFAARVANADERTAKKGNIFQRLDDVADLFADHAGIDLKGLAGADRWSRLQRAFAQRHVLLHKGGIIDEKFLSQVPDTTLKLGQRLFVRRVDGEAARDDLDVVVRALSSA